MIGGDSSPVDVVDLSSSALGALCNDGLLETIEASSLGAAPSGESAEQDFFTGGLTSCGVASVAWSTAIAFDRQAFTKAQPSQIADLLDLKRFPGKRALPNSPRYTLELALLADGVDPANVYTELATPEGVDRAFKALDKIKNDTFWWDSAQEPISWLLEKKAVMAAGYSGRIFRAAVGDSKRLGVIWDGQVYDLDLWAIPKGAKNKDGAKRFIVFASDPARLAAQAELIAYGPMRKSALQLVGKNPVINVEMKDFLPTSPDNFKKALRFDEAWWSAHGEELTKRFQEWRGPGDGKPHEPKPEEADAKSADLDCCALELRLEYASHGTSKSVLHCGELTTAISAMQFRTIHSTEKENAGKTELLFDRLSSSCHADAWRESSGSTWRHRSYTGCTIQERDAA